MTREVLRGVPRGVSLAYRALPIVQAPACRTATLVHLQCVHAKASTGGCCLVVRVDCTRVHLKGAIDGRSCSYLLHTSVMLLLAAYLQDSSCDSSLILLVIAP